MKYTAPKAEVVELDVGSVMLFSNFCIIDDLLNSDCEDKLPDFYG